MEVSGRFAILLRSLNYELIGMDGPQRHFQRLEGEWIMRKTTIVLVAGCVSALTLAALSLGVAHAQQSPKEDAGQDVAMQKAIAYMTPGPEHELLKYKVGKWTVKMQMWTAPGTAPIASQGTAEVELILGGRYLRDTTKSDFQGQAFEGRSFTGFDKLKKKFVSVWIDNFGTGFTTSTGIYDKATKTFHYATTAPDAQLGEYKRTRTVERIVSADEWVMEMYNTTADDKEFLMMKAVYKRVKS